MQIPTLRPISGFFDQHDLAEMASVLDELCREAALRQWRGLLPPEEMKHELARIILRLQHHIRHEPEVLKAMARVALDHQSPAGLMPHPADVISACQWRTGFHTEPPAIPSPRRNETVQRSPWGSISTFTDGA